MLTKYAVYWIAVRKYVLPILIGGLVVYLVNGGHDHLADAVCSISDAFAISVKECR